MLSCSHVDHWFACCGDLVAAGTSISVRGVGSSIRGITSPVVREGEMGSGRARVTVMHALQMQCQV